MCGITGYIGTGSEEILRQMATAIKHRGPDDEGIFVHENVGLGHLRLSIIDLSPAGHQPMFSSDKSVGISFNGEIYNFRELRAECEKKGFQFKSSSDTEVILALYSQVGEKVFEKLNGQFALALYDFKKQTLLLARDRMGEKPLYYSIVGTTLVFGSEPKALLQHPAIKHELDLFAVRSYLWYEYVPAPYSIFKNIYKLEPGSYAVWHNNTLTKQSFYKLAFAANKTNSFSEAVTELDKRISAATAAQLVADVPLGIFLSGGIDSSTIAYYAQKASAQKIKTYSIGFEEKTFDESSYARQVAKHLGTDHHEQILSARDALDLIPTIARLVDEPLADASIIPTYLLSRFTRQHVTVALGGDGGDELFAGYGNYLADRVAQWYMKTPSLLRSGIIEPLAHAIPDRDSYMSVGFLAKRFAAAAGYPPLERNQKWIGSFDAAAQEQLLTRDFLEQTQGWDPFDSINQAIAEANTTDKNNQLIATYLRTYMQGDILVKVDRASMYNALEVRAPFLDYQVVDFVNSLPYTYKLHGLTQKYILKKLMEDKLPAEIVYRKKKGFGIPLGAWLKKELKDFMLETLSEKKITASGIVQYDAVRKLIEQHLNGTKDNRKELWTLITLQLWINNWLTV